MANSSFYSGTGTNPTDVDSITSSKTAAETAATNAATSEANAATSATNAAASATDASNSASSISGSVAAAASSATDSANSATSSSTSATQAATSASNAAASATSASTSAASATSSASSSADSALDASGSATAAASSATSASTSASNAATSEANAATSASQAATSASTAQAAAANTDVATVSSNVSYVQTVADNISDVETVSNNVLKINTVADNISDVLGANTASTQAISSAADAASSATQAASSATSAATSASTATAAKDAALEALDNFDDRYLGQKASDPTVDNDGDALVAGALYFDTTTDTMKVYDGSIWVAAYASLSGALIAANNLSDVTNVTTARTNLGLGTAATTASTDYATAAQGTLADTSVQPNDSPTFGSITVTGTVDGRDVAADGTKLDAIEASADVTDTANVTAAGALMDSELTSEASVKALDQGVATTDSPTFAGLTTTADVSFGDYDKATFGDGPDLQIYSDGTTGQIVGDVNITGTLTSDGLRVDGVGSKVTFDTVGAAATAYVASANTGDIKIATERGSAGSLVVGANDTSMIFGIGAPKTYFNLNENGDISFYEDTGTTAKFFWDASAQRLGLNESTPTNVLTVGDDASITVGKQWGIDFKDDVFGKAQAFINAEGRYTDNYNTDLVFGTIGTSGDATERMRIDSSGNVGIGTSSPDSLLEVEASAGARIRMTDTGTQSYTIGNVGTSFNIYNESQASEAMRIDSSGNLLVGKTSSSASTTGAELQKGSGGQSALIATAAGTKVGIINRTTSDGDLLEFRKDGTTVGSIGAWFGVLHIGTANCAIRFRDDIDAITPMNGDALTNRDAAIDIGTSSYRFKDLYLSGGVYLGGTGSANKLDDYETGTWTPTITGGFTGSGLGKYTKVGDIVYVTANLYRPADISSSTEIQIGGWPFTPASLGHWQLLNISMRYTNVDEKIVAGVMIDSSSTYHGKILIFSDSGSDYQYLTHSASTSSYWTFQVSGTYKTA